MVDAVVAAEDAGIDELWLGDEGPSRDPFSVLAAAAQRTERITLGVSVTNPFLRHPAVTAATAMTLNELSGGRFVLGLGPGGGMALDPVGVVRDRPLTRTRDALRVIRAVAERRPTDGFSATVARHSRRTVASGDRRAAARSSTASRRSPPTACSSAASPDPCCRARSNGPAACGRSTSASTSTPSPTSASSSTCARRSSGRWPTLPRSPRDRLGIDASQLASAITCLQNGDDRLARQVVTDDVVGELVIVGDAAAVTAGLHGYISEFDPDAIGLLLHPDGDPVGAVMAAGDALRAVNPVSA